MAPDKTKQIIINPSFLQRCLEFLFNSFDAFGAWIYSSILKISGKVLLGWGAYVLVSYCLMHILGIISWLVSH